METIEQLQARHANELQKAQQRAAIVAELPQAPHHVMDTYNCHWVTYKTPTLAAVADIVRIFAPLVVPTVELRDGVLYRMPLELYPDSRRERADAEGREVVFSLEVHQGRGFGPTAEFYFYARLQSGRIVKVKCDLPDSWRAGARLTAPNFDRHGHPDNEGRAEPNLTLRSLFHDYIAWSPNTRGLDARYTYTLCDDGPEYRETLEILNNPEVAALWPAKV